MSTLVPLNSINISDTVWVMISSILVIFMTIPGLSLFYGGLVRKKNVISILMKSFAICGVITILWFAYGYSLSFTTGNGLIGNFSELFLSHITWVSNSTNLISVNHEVTNIPESAFVLFELSFAIITVALITGGFAERMKFSACLIFSIIWFSLVYLPIAHMVWDSTGYMYKLGILDFAGGTVVHITAGVAGLLSAIIVGKRNTLNYKEKILPYNVIFTAVGAAMLWIGWFGFNGGSALAANAKAAIAILNTQLAAASGLISWMLVEWIIIKKPSIIGVCAGAVAGLVGITPAAGFVTPGSSIIIGLISGFACYFSCNYVKRVFGYDDALDAFGIHGVGGVIGSILTGLLANPKIAGVTGHVFLQIKCVAITIAYTTIITLIILLTIKSLWGLRVDVEGEKEGLDISLHGDKIL